MKTILSIIILIAMATYSEAQEKKNFYDFTVTDIDGNPFPLAQFKGKKVLVVNVASKCGNTPQYEQLEQLYRDFGGTGFVIIGFPANNFLGQEPGTNEEIKTFCQVNYGVTFPMMSKISVKGDGIAPLYQWLTKKSENGVLDAPVTWNFQKFMIDENGNMVDFAPPKELPTSPRIVTWIQNNPQHNPSK
jgi:glutathione peroxidase